MSQRRALEPRAAAAHVPLSSPMEAHAVDGVRFTPVVPAGPAASTTTTAATAAPGIPGPLATLPNTFVWRVAMPTPLYSPCSQQTEPATSTLGNTVNSKSAQVVMLHLRQQPTVPSEGKSPTRPHDGIVKPARARKPKEPQQPACTNCQRSHVACDRGQPCSHCIRTEQVATCVLARHMKRGWPVGRPRRRSHHHSPIPLDPTATDRPPVVSVGGDDERAQSIGSASQLNADDVSPSNSEMASMVLCHLLPAVDTSSQQLSASHGSLEPADGATPAASAAAGMTATATAAGYGTSGKSGSATLAGHSAHDMGELPAGIWALDHLMRFAFESVPLALLSVDGVCHRASRALADLLHCSPDALTTCELGRWIPIEEERTQIRRALAACCASTTALAPPSIACHGRWQGAPAMTEPVPVSLHIVPYRGLSATGRPTAALAIVRSCTATCAHAKCVADPVHDQFSHVVPLLRAAIREDLRNATTTADRTLDAPPAAASCALLLDLEGRVRLCSDDIVGLLGYQPSEIVNVWIYNLLRASERASLNEWHSCVAKSTTPERSPRIWVRHKNGAYVPVDFVGCSIVDMRNNHPISILTIVTAAATAS